MFCGIRSPPPKVVDGFMRKVKTKSAKGDTTAGLVDQLNLEEFASVLDNAPPGTDELVALSKVWNGMVWYRNDMVWYGILLPRDRRELSKAWYGIVWYCMVKQWRYRAVGKPLKRARGAVKGMVWPIQIW